MSEARRAFGRFAEGPVAVFAGTVEGRLLCERLSAAGRSARAFVATEYGGELVEGLPGIEVNVGRLDARAMGRALAGAAVAVDATHPYALEASANVRAAAEAAGRRAFSFDRLKKCFHSAVHQTAPVLSFCTVLSRNRSAVVL